MNKLDTIACITDTVTKILTSENKIPLCDLDTDIKKIKNMIIDYDYESILRAYAKIKYPDSELILTDSVYEDNHSLSGPKK